MLRLLNKLKQQDAPQLRGSFNLSVLLAVLRGNSRRGINRGHFAVYPEHSSESLNPQKVPRVKR
jgi:hypothetical protein